jgi:hypothetical protein
MSRFPATLKWMYYLLAACGVVTPESLIFIAYPPLQIDGLSALLVRRFYF